MSGRKVNLVMTAKELNLLVEELLKVFDVVRTVDVNQTKVITFDKDGNRVVSDYCCYEIWNKERRCENCISSMVCKEKRRLSKFEFIRDEIYFVTSEYIIVDGEPCVLEVVEENNDTFLEATFGRNEFVNRLKNFANELYTDSLTKALNRKYLDDQLSELTMDAVAMLDVDDFKEINDTYGHPFGDIVLERVASVLLNSVRTMDTVVRYGGDEFLIAFSKIQHDELYDVMKRIREAVRRIEFVEKPEVKVTVSIGAVCQRTAVRNNVSKADQALYQSKSEKDNITIL